MEVDVIEDALTQVFDSNISEFSCGSNVLKNECWNSDMFDDGCYLNWSSNSFSKRCSYVSQLCRDVDVKLRAADTADILACLKFEYNNYSGPYSSNSRRLQFSTGYSISVENLYPSDGLSENDCDGFLNDSEYACDFDGHFSGQQSNHKRKHGQRQCIDADQGEVFYSNPFDLNINFSGLTGISDQSTDDLKNGNAGSNFLLALDDPTSHVNDYLHEYRKFVCNLSNDIHTGTKQAQIKSDYMHLESLERIARRHLPCDDANQLVSNLYRVHNVRHLWAECDDPGVSISEEDLEPDTETLETSTGNNSIQVEINSPEKQHHSTQDASHADTESDSVPYSNPEHPRLDEPNPIPHAPVHDNTQDLERGPGDFTSLDGIVQHLSRKYVDPNCSEKDIQTILLSFLKGQTNGQHILDEGTPVDCMETDLDTTRISDSGKSELHSSTLESDHSGTDHIEVSQEINNSTDHVEEHGQLGNMQHSPQQPVPVHPYVTSGFWGDSDADRNVLNSVVPYPPSSHREDNAATTATMVNSKDNQVVSVQNPQLGAPSFHSNPFLQSQMIQRPHHHNFHESQQIVPYAFRDYSPWHHPFRQPYLQQYKHHVSGHPVMVPGNYQVPPPPFLQRHPHPKDYSLVPSQSMRPLFQLEQVNVPPIGLKKEASRCSNKYGDTKHCKPTAPNSTNTQQPMRPNSHFNETVNQNPLIHKHSDQPTPFFGQNVQNVARKPDSAMKQTEPNSVVSHFQTRTIPTDSHATKARASNQVNGVSDIHLIHPNDPNFRLDDEIWYINGIPHRHARPVYNPLSPTPFYPTNRPVNTHDPNIGINRRIAEQVEKINQAFIHTPQNTVTTLARAAKHKPVDLSLHQSHGQRGNNVNVTPYPVYSDPMMTIPYKTYQCQPSQKAGKHGLGNINNNNIQLNEGINDIPNDFDGILKISDEEITCFGELGESEYNHLDFNTTNWDIDNYVSNAGTDMPAHVNELFCSGSSTSSLDSQEEFINHGRKTSTPRVRDIATGESMNCDIGEQPTDPDFVDGLPKEEIEQECGHVRHIRVLGRNRHQKEKERVVKKKKDINRKVLVQLV